MIKNQRFGLFLDFDGTISELAPTPEQAKITKKMTNLLVNLSRKLTVLSVISGRSVGDIRGRTGVKDVIYVGNHGTEYQINDCLEVVIDIPKGIERLTYVYKQLQEIVDVPGMVWEHKGYSASVHYRLCSDRNVAERALSRALELMSVSDKLDVFWGKYVLELRLPNGLHKGDAITRIVRDYDIKSLVFIGDDTTDIDAMKVISNLRSQKMPDCAAVVVICDDTPRELINIANYSLRGVPEVERFLLWLNEMIR